MVTERHERGQLILITAIAVAFILLAIIIVFNGLLFTQTIASEDASKATEDVMATEQELSEGVQGIVLRSNVNEDEESEWGSDVETYIENNYREAIRGTRPAIVNVTDYGTRTDALLINSTTDEIENSQRTILDVENEADSPAIGYFTLELEPDQDVSIKIDGGTIQLTDDQTECDIDGSETVRIDLIQETADQEGCDVEFDLEAGGYETIEIENATSDTEFTIDYALVVKDEDGDVDEYVDEDTNGYYDAAWGVEVEYTYDSSDVTATRTVVIENVYEDADHLWPWSGQP